MKPYTYLYAAKSFFGTFFPSNELTSVEIKKKKINHVSRKLHKNERKQNNRVLPRRNCCQVVSDKKQPRK